MISIENSSLEVLPAELLAALLGIHGESPLTRKPTLQGGEASRLGEHHCLEATQLPLHGTPDDDALHLPEPALPSRCPWA